MTLLDEIKAASQNPGPVCSVLRLEDSGHKHFAELAAAIRDHSLSAAAIARVVKGDRYKMGGITAHTILRHRNNACGSCSKRGLTW